ncbi:MAG: hypothetical protein ABSE49_23455 [Polyangiaceae bacterium]|jgi:hypothetical protein
MAPRVAVLLAALLSPLAVAACAADATGNTRGGAQNPNPNPNGIGPNGGVGVEPRDMSGGGRGGNPTPHGKGL